MYCIEQFAIECFLTTVFSRLGVMAYVNKVKYFLLKNEKKILKCQQRRMPDG